MNLAQLRAAYAAKIDRLKVLRGLETRTAEESVEVRTLVDEAKALDTEIRSLVDAEAAISAHEEARSTSAGRASQSDSAHAGSLRVETRAEDEETRSVGEQVTDNDEFRSWQSNPSGPYVHHLETRTLQTFASTPPTGWVRAQRVGGIDRLSEPYGSLRDVLLTGSTTSTTLEFFREDVFTNNAAFVGEATAFSGSSGLKPESAITYDRDTAEIGTIAHYIPVTNQFEWDAPELRSLIDGRLIDGLNRVEDLKLLLGDGTGEDPVGLLETNGLQLLDTTYFTTNPTRNVGTDAEPFDRVARAKRLIADVGRTKATFAVISPEDDEMFSTLMDANGHYYGGGPYAASNVRTLWGLRVVISEHMPEGEALIGDGRYAQVWDRMQATIQVGYVNDQFIRNQKTILAEKRVGLAVYRPSAFAHVTLVD